MNVPDESFFGFGSTELPKGIGASIKGWNIPESHFRDPTKLGGVLDFRAMTNACPLDCVHCFTKKNKVTITLEEIQDIIRQAAKLGVSAIDFLGEGEPSLDPHFLEILQFTTDHGIQPVVYTEGATKFRNREFAQAVKKTGASIVLKCDSLFNPEFQNSVVRDTSGKYFAQRAEALQVLMEEGFNDIAEDGTTRLGFDMVVCKKNMHEVTNMLRFCRNNNLWVMFPFYLTSGRSNDPDFDTSLVLSKAEKRQVIECVRKIDKTEYSFKYPEGHAFICFPCVERVQIAGNGDITICPAKGPENSENVLGNIQTSTLTEIHEIIYSRYPEMDPGIATGHCPFREDPYGE